MTAPKKINTIGKIIVVLLAVALLSSFRVKKVADKVKLKGWDEQPKYYAQELRVWGQGEVSMPDKPVDMDGYTVYKYKMDKSVLEEYIALLEDNGFTLVDEHHQSSFLGSYQSYGLLCDKAKKVDTIQQMYTHTDCHISIWKDGSKWRMDVADGISLWDDGSRQDGTTGSTLPRGESVTEGLKKKGEKYKTTDGRLTAKTGQAAVIVGKKEYTVDARRSKAGNDVEITVKITDQLTAQINIDLETINQSRIYQLCNTRNRPVSFKLDNGDKKIGIGQTGAMHYHNVTVRPMYLDDGDNIVLYVYAQPIDTENYPQSVEMLCAVNVTPRESSGGGGGVLDGGREPFRPDHSKLDCLTCNGTGDCKTCGGSTYVGFGDARAKCNTCRGSGDCRTCGGTGKR